MKAIIPIVAAICISCSTHQQQTSAVIDPNDYIPRKEFELTVADYTARQSSPHTEEVAENIRYEQSVAKIEQLFRDEQLQLTMCYDLHGKKHRRCIELKKQFCEVDMWLDSRSGRHSKSFCAP